MGHRARRRRELKPERANRFGGAGRRRTSRRRWPESFSRAMTPPWKLLEEIDRHAERVKRVEISVEVLVDARRP